MSLKEPDFSDEGEDVMLVHTSCIQDHIQYFFNNSMIAETMGGYLDVRDDEWVGILKRFKKTFKKTDDISNTFIVDMETLFTFINDEIANLIENSMLQMVDANLLEMCVDETGDIIFRNKIL